MQIGLLKQREFITLLGGAASASMTRPYMAHGQTNRVRRVGILLAGSENDLEFQAQISALKKGLQELGWTEGRNVRFEYRWPGDDPERTRAYAAEIVGLAPDVIVTGTTPAAVVMRRETRSIPVVFVNLADPVGTGWSPAWPSPVEI
jgi:putative ABC transport system substrate-binding protein